MSVTFAAYQDILFLSRPISKHPKMSVESRAKLFTPFSALRGFVSHRSRIGCWCRRSALPTTRRRKSTAF